MSKTSSITISCHGYRRPVCNLLLIHQSMYYLHYLMKIMINIILIFTKRTNIDPLKFDHIYCLDVSRRVKACLDDLIELY